MSIRLMADLWDDEAEVDLKGNALLVALALADYANDDGVCWPKLGTIARRTRMTERSITRILASLRGEGLIAMPEGKRSKHAPFVVGRQNVLDTPVYVDQTEASGSNQTQASGPYVEPPGLNRKGTNLPNGSKRQTASEIEREVVARVWAYWIEISGRDKMKLDDKRRGHIRNALQLVGEDGTMLALLGLTRSPFHNGENEQHKKYLDIHYALRGKGDESDDSRIELAITWAAVHAPGQVLLSQAKVDRYLEEIRYTASLPHHPERERGIEAWRKLKAAGFNVTKLDKAPWARLEQR